MLGHIRSIGYVGVLLAIGCGVVRAQSSDISALQVLRFQAASIAEEVMGRFRTACGDSTHIGVRVEARFNRAFVENAFLDVLAKAGLAASPSLSEPLSGSSLQVFVVDQVVQYSAIAEARYVRSIRTSLDARCRAMETGEVKYLGSFWRSSVDTVSTRETFPVIDGLGDGSTADKLSFIEKVAGPVMMIAGAFLIVYLFFTVRD